MGNRDENSVGAARFYGQWFKAAFRHSFNQASVVATVISLIVALGTYIANRYDAKVKLLEQINAIGGWGYALVAAGVLVVARLILAPYWLWKEERKRAQELQDKLSDYDETPVFPIVEMSSNSEQIRVKLINKGRNPEPIESVRLYLCDGARNEAFQLISDSDETPPPLTMAGKANHRVIFDICGAHCIQWGVQSLFAVVHLQDGRNRESEHYTIRNSAALDELLVAPVEHAPGRTWEQSMVRHKRIQKVARAYRAAAGIIPRNKFAINRFRDLNDAQIRELEDASEVHELLAILDANQIPHPFNHGEDANAILWFYKEAIPVGISIGGIVEWTKAYNEWFGASLPIPE